MTKRKLEKKHVWIYWLVMGAFFFAAIPVEAACITSPVSFWKLEEDGGPGFIDSVGSGDGLCVPASTNCPTMDISGRVDNAQSFDGGNDEIDITDSSGFNFAADASFTIEFWMKAPDGSITSGNEIIVGRDDNAATGVHWWVGIDDDAGSTVDVAAFVLIPNGGGGPTPPTLVGSSDVSDGNWHHIVAVRDAGNLQNLLYVDGVLEGSENCTEFAGDFTTTNTINFGHLNFDGTDGFHYEGLLDEVAIYTSALSQEIIETHYQNGLVSNTYCDPLAPSILVESLADAVAGYDYVADIQSAGNPQPTFDFSGNEPDGMTFSSPSTGEIDWHPIDTQSGGNTFTVTATDGTDTDSQDFTVTVVDLCSDLMTSYWKLEEDGGPGFIDSVGSGDGLCVPASTNCPTMDISGRVDNAQSFDGSNDEIDITNSTSFDWAADASFTIEFWMKAPDGSITSGNEIIVGRDDGTTNAHWWVGIDDQPGTVDVAAFVLIPNGGGGPTAPTLVGSSDLSDGAWHHVVAVRDAENSLNLLYVDGVLEGSECNTYSGDFTSTNTVNFGYLNFDGGDAFHYEGLLDEVAIYDAALTAAVIQQHNDDGLLNRGYCNTAPVIISQSVLSTNEDEAITITLSDLDVTDPDDTYPNDFTLMVQDGVNYTRSGNTITPALDFSGALTVNSTVNDGMYTSNTFPLSVTVNPVDDDDDDDDGGGGGGGGGGGSCFIDTLK